MIISHKHKFIFIKTVKTAGTSIEVSLNKVLGPYDVSTPILPPVEQHRAQNFTWLKWGFFERQYYNHMPALEVREAIGRRIFRDYYVFCVEREPIDKSISHYSMLRNSPTHNNNTGGMTIEEYVERANFPVDTQKYTDRNGNLIVDRILHYETLADDLRQVGEVLGFNLTLTSLAKAGFREDLRLSEPQIDKIYRAFETSNHFTGYCRQEGVHSR